jgi:hypothetical protein
MPGLALVESAVEVVTFRFAMVTGPSCGFTLKVELKRVN